MVPKWQQFLQKFPSWSALAKAPTAEVIRAWSSLGYNLRGVRLQRLAQEVIRVYGGRFPESRDALQRLPGIGPYTAAALACFAFDQDVAVLDTNVRRVLSRVFFGIQPVGAKVLEDRAHQEVPLGRASTWNQALMDVGALLCTVRSPQCPLCPLQPHCTAAPLLQGAPRRVAEASAPYRTSRSPFRGSRRYYRGRIVEALRQQSAAKGLPIDDLGASIKGDYAPGDRPWLLNLLRGLERDGLVRIDEGGGEDPGTVGDTTLTVSLP